ncbi:MAG: NAD-dependent epimerase/dehydratase family protein [Dehalococcoidales bacterium]|nr:NAD-dependent epimerase/dehydratase family protein [Dehalococcoidales bacterium]
MKVLVTGGAGFIGSHTVDLFIESGYEVVVVDNLVTGFKRNLHPRAKFYHLDISSPDLQKVFEVEKPAGVVHLAAQTVVTRSIRDPLFDAHTNISGSLNVLFGCLNHNIKRIVYSSSCAVYGDPVYLPVDENHPVKPLSPYGVSKHTFEHYLTVYHLLNGLSFAGLRYANVYGPRQYSSGEGGVVAIFATRMLRGEQPVIYGTGNKSRDYIYVQDVARANLLAFHSDVTGFFNIGTGIETFDHDIFDYISHECAYSSPPFFTAERPGEIKRIFLSIQKAARELKWQPQVSLQAGITRTVAYYRELLHEEHI